MLQVPVRAYIEAERVSIRAANQSIHQAVKDNRDGGRTSSMPMWKLLKYEVQERKGVPDAPAGTEGRVMNGILSSLRMKCPKYTRGMMNESAQRLSVLCLLCSV